MKDKQIQQLFDEYADTLEPQTHLAAKAREVCRASSRRKSAGRRFDYKSVLAICCVLVVLVVLGVSLQVARHPHENLSAIAYDLKDVRGRSVSKESVADVLGVDALQRCGYTIVGERYYAFYFKDSDTLAYVKAIIAVSTENGVVELNVVAENNAYLRTDLKRYYSLLSKNDGNLVQGLPATEKGEYVTSAFFEARENHFYIAARGNVHTEEDVNKIIRLFV